MKKGFTLIEIIIDIVLLGIVSMIGIGIISSVFSGYSDSVTKSYLYSEARFIIERINRELRNSIPNTVRTDSGLIQFAKFDNASYYEIFHNKKRFIPVEENIVSINDNISIYNTSTNIFYTKDRVYRIDSITPFTKLNKKIEEDSPYNRFYKISTPVTFYIDDKKLKRCSKYPINPSDYGEDSKNCYIMGNYLADINFEYTPVTPGGNGQVKTDLILSKNNIRINLSSKVILRNVP
ncbi:MAG: prepilin-type N-terminal cleavage/methylation domain-containing protein [Flexistipes sinusarabici]|uniref:Prepilin-type N-terminal cleavage/methylation domain-containing protein n=1 Tax=Flexistipes sinusarabici TaxID=2352 RepID=A0A5D0MQ21_FLESI|nr:prepilin-type N-terminal cleavage/methylation domain-containing protein [Flexistipes sinusarabici]TYB33448.1 MAG: prepilin-type N-terminal cleavage/methylation domain-containing protein [Flexistipes sinusarabici]